MKKKENSARAILAEHEVIFMTTFTCTKCTEELKGLRPAQTVVCPNCGYPMHWAKMEPECEELHAKAIWYQRDGQFYNALQMYDIILRRWDGDWAAAFGAVLAEYGVVYQNDHEGHYTLTCQRTMAHRVYEDEYYKKAIGAAPPDVRADYESTAALIDEAQKKNEEEYRRNAPTEEDRDYRSEALSEDYLHARERYLQKEREEAEEAERRRADIAAHEKDAAVARENRRRLAEKKQHRKKVALLLGGAVTLCALLIFVWFSLISPAIRTSRMNAALSSGDKATAATLARSLSGKEARAVASRLRLYGLSVGDRVTFGSYEQDANAENGAEPIVWLVLKAEDDSLLLLSESVLDCQMYQKDKSTPAYWETCSVREFLNNDFYRKAFLPEAADLILLTHNETPDNTRCGTKGGNPTDDSVFLLSLEEVTDCFADPALSGYLAGVPTPYAAAAGVYIKKGYTTTYWWLRSPGGSQNSAANISYTGEIEHRGAGVDYKSYGVRPAIRVRIAEYPEQNIGES